MSNHKLVFSGQPGDLAHRQLQIDKLLLVGSFLALFDQGVAPQSDQDNGFILHGDDFLLYILRLLRLEV